MASYDITLSDAAGCIVEAILGRRYSGFGPMCLTIRAELSGVAESDLRAISSAWSDDGIHFGFEGGGILHRHAPRLAAHGCELLADDADWHAATWAMEPEAAARLSDAISWLLERAPSSVIATALWEGDEPDDEATLSRVAFVELVRSSRLGTRTRYTILR